MLPYYAGADEAEVAADFCDNAVGPGDAHCTSMIHEALVQQNRMQLTGRVTPNGGSVLINHNTTLMPWVLANCSAPQPRSFRVRGAAHAQATAAITTAPHTATAMEPPDEEEAAMLAHPESEGFAVVRGAATRAELRALHLLLWRFLERFDGRNSMSEVTGAPIIGVGGGSPMDMAKHMEATRPLPWMMSTDMDTLTGRKKTRMQQPVSKHCAESPPSVPSS